MCPTIVVPGPWSAADIRFQAEQVATQKLHNSGFNCVACQVLVLPKDGAQKTAFVQALENVIGNALPRGLYYPGAPERLAEFCTNNPTFKAVKRPGAQDLVISTLDLGNAKARSTEVFAPALSVVEIGGHAAEAYLIAAIELANSQLYGTLGANIVVHPHTIAINAWTGLGFLSAQSPWGAFPGHTLDDVQSGIGVGAQHPAVRQDRTRRGRSAISPVPTQLAEFVVYLAATPTVVC